MRRLELILFAFFLAAWIVDFLALLRLVDLAGSLELGLYPLFSLAAIIGWIAGNIYVPRSRRLPPELRRASLLVYYLGPPGLLYLIREMATEEAQREAPLVPVYAFAVFTVFFLVPVILKRSPPSRLRLGDPGRDD